MRRLLAPLMAAGLLMLLPGVVAYAGAAPVRSTAQVSAAVAHCPKAPAYPTHPNATVEVDTTVPHVGDPLEIRGIHYCPNEDVALTIAGQPVGTGHTDSAGSFDPQVTTPGPPGRKQVCGVGASGRSFDRDCLFINVQGAGSSSAAPPPNSGGGTAFTGVQIALLGVAALVLVVGGVVVTTLGRNRRPERA